MVRIPPSPLGELLPRRAHAVVTEALADTRVVLLNGARQCGKSTLAAQIAVERGARWRSLDHASTLEAALHDPTDFVDSVEPIVIDEVQRAPGLMLAIKEQVDADPRPGRFLVTGSARVLGLRSVPDALPGRLETVELWPLSQGEVDAAPDGFVDAIFGQGIELRHSSAETRDGYARRVVRGGYPGALAREGRRRERFFDEYVADLINRDVTQLLDVQRGSELRALTRVLAARSAQELVPGSLSGHLRISQPTIRRYIALLEEMFLIKLLPAWSRNISRRAVSTPKCYFVDSGVAASLLAFDESGLRTSPETFGRLLEGFVAMEIARQLTWSHVSADLFHYRTKDKVEVDLVLEDRRGRVVAIEVKSSATVRGDDFRGLRHLEQRLGDDLLVGAVLYAGHETLAFGPRLRAMPVSAVWEASAS